MAVSQTRLVDGRTQARAGISKNRKQSRVNERTSSRHALPNKQPTCAAADPSPLCRFPRPATSRRQGQAKADPARRRAPPLTSESYDNPHWPLQPETTVPTRVRRQRHHACGSTPFPFSPTETGRGPDRLDLEQRVVPARAARDGCGVGLLLSCRVGWWWWQPGSEAALQGGCAHPSLTMRDVCEAAICAFASSGPSQRQSAQAQEPWDQHPPCVSDRAAVSRMRDDAVNRHTPETMPETSPLTIPRSLNHNLRLAPVHYIGMWLNKE